MIASEQNIEQHCFQIQLITTCQQSFITGCLQNNSVILKLELPHSSNKKLIQDNVRGCATILETSKKDNHVLKIIKSIVELIIINFMTF